MKLSLWLTILLPLFACGLRAQEEDTRSDLPRFDAAKFAALLQRLEADEFEAREAATVELGEMGLNYKQAVEQTLQKTDSAEIRDRLRKVLNVYRYQLREGEAVQGIQLALTPSAKTFVGQEDALAKFKLELRNLASERLVHELKTVMLWCDAPRPPTPHGRSEWGLFSAPAILEIKVTDLAEGAAAKPRHLTEKTLRMEILDLGQIKLQDRKVFPVALRLRESDRVLRKYGLEESDPQIISQVQYAPGEYEIEVILKIRKESAFNQPDEDEQNEFTVSSNKVRFKVTPPEPKDGGAGKLEKGPEGQGGNNASRAQAAGAEEMDGDDDLYKAMEELEAAQRAKEQK